MCAEAARGVPGCPQGSLLMRGAVGCRMRVFQGMHALAICCQHTVHVRDQQGDLHGSHDGDNSSRPSGAGSKASSLIQRARARTRFPPALSPISTILQGFLVGIFAELLPPATSVSPDVSLLSPYATAGLGRSSLEAGPGDVSGRQWYCRNTCAYTAAASCTAAGNGACWSNLYSTAVNSKSSIPPESAAVPYRIFHRMPCPGEC